MTMMQYNRLIAILLVLQLVIGPIGLAWGQSGSRGKGGGQGSALRGTSKEGAGGGKGGVASAGVSDEQVPGGTALSRAIIPDQYIIGPGDGLTITFWGEYDDTNEVRVAPDGKINLPTIGSLPVNGLSLTEVQALVNQEVQRYYRNVRTDVSLSALRVFQVEVLGELTTPGSYTATPVKRVSDLVGQAGGILPGGSQRHVQLMRNGHVAAVADLTAFLRRGEENSNPFVQDGDVIFVPSIGPRVVVYVSEVSTGGGSGALTENAVPSLVEIKEGETLSSVLSEVGGLSPWWDLESVFIQRTSQAPEGAMRIPVDLRQYYFESDKSQDVVLVSGDQVFIPAAIKRVFVIGAVKAPAAYTYLPGRSADAYLMQAGGPLLTADLERSFIKRTDGSEEPYSAVAELNNGDSIIVLEKIFKTWQDYFALVGTISGVILGLVGFYAAFTNFGR
jgi:protein involved in polysaccharide export with SLBB domain